MSVSVSVSCRVFLFLTNERVDFELRAIRHGRELRLSIKPNSSVVAKRGTKTMKGEGFYVTPPGGGGQSDAGGKRGDMIVGFRVMSHVEVWLKRGHRMWWAKAAGYTVGGLGVAWLGLNVLAWALDIDLAAGNRTFASPFRGLNLTHINTTFRDKWMLEC